MSRPDLLALTPEALASLANMGLVKRAQRELAEGAGPALEELEDGTVVGTFKDGVVAKLLPGKPIKETPCTCAATGACRHRVAVALAYKPWHAAEHEGGPPPSSARVPLHWSPAEIDDAALEVALGARTLDRARAARKKGVLVTVERDGVPTAKLPSCTVRFLVPRDVAYARCDCAQAGGACEHLALAVWAFREARGDAASVVVAMGGGASPARSEVLDVVSELVRDVLGRGIAETLPSPARFAEVRTRVDREGLTWVNALVVDLQIALEGYRARSALYGTREIAGLLMELGARLRASRQGGELPARFVLGEDEAPETLLDHVRLVSLGARVRSDGRTRFADVFLADPDTTLVLVLRKRWEFDEKTEPEEGPALARRSVATRMLLGTLAHGQVVSKVVKRRANRSINLGTSRVAQTSVTPQRGEWGTLPSPLLVKDLEEHAGRIKQRPPRVLRPRVLAEEVHVVEVSQVVDVAYVAAEQQLLASLLDAAGNPFTVVVRHRRAAPHALDAVGAALARNVRFVAGNLARGPLGWQVDPLAVAADDMVVPDLAGPIQAPPPSPVAVHAHPGAIDAALDAAESALEELCHAGVSGASRAVTERCGAAAQRCDDAGVAGLGVRLRALESRARTAGPEGADAWLDAAVRLNLVREAR